VERNKVSQTCAKIDFVQPRMLPQIWQWQQKREPKKEERKKENSFKYLKKHIFFVYVGTIQRQKEARDSYLVWTMIPTMNNKFIIKI
jgi:siroheme synthase (precorrin-2 oxidase/ferrochelatase)